MELSELHRTHHTASGFNPGYDTVDIPINVIDEKGAPVIDYTLFTTTQRLYDQGINFTGPITRVRVKGELKVPSWTMRRIEANERLSSSTTTRDYYEFDLGCSAFLLIKIDEAITRSDTVQQHIAEILTGAERNRIKFVLQYVTELQDNNVHSSNWGNNAGLHKNYNLGTLHDPLLWDAEHLSTICSVVKLVLADHNMYDESRSFALIPLEATHALEELQTTRLSATSIKDEAFHPYFPQRLYGFNFIVDTERTLYSHMQDNAPVFSILFGNPAATVFYCSDIDALYGGTSDVTILHSFLRCLIFFGGKVVHPEGLVSVTAAIPAPRTKAYSAP